MIPCPYQAGHTLGVCACAVQREDERGGHPGAVGCGDVAEALWAAAARAAVAAGADAQRLQPCGARGLLGGPRGGSWGGCEPG